MNGQLRSEIQRGLAVAVILKQDQRSGRLTCGIVQDILTSAPRHSRGIKVRLMDGQVGRVQGLSESLPTANSTEQKSKTKSPGT